MRNFSNYELALIHRAMMLLAFTTESQKNHLACVKLANDFQSEINVRQMLLEDEQKDHP